MLARGLSGGNTSVCAALSAVAADNVDSDGDGKTDVAELETFGDPNTAANISWAQEPTPTYGCGVASDSPGGGMAATVSMLAALVVLRRTRRRT
jgi:MYXO-CTERM domain-containing protein